MVLRQSEPGLIPAWAGRSPAGGSRHGCRWAHPRVGGEVQRILGLTADGVGSSPRGRGGLPSSGIRRRWRGLIPAWAGRSSAWNTASAAARAHPRVGGEVLHSNAAGDAMVGSSPRGRGGPIWRPVRVERHGLIPAWAGRSWDGPRLSDCDRAHPRVGGEVPTPTDLFRVAEGSSPRGRGGPPLRHLRASVRGLIPAWAGRSTARAPRPTLDGAHPRVGGEVTFYSPTAGILEGSSPRGRGGRDRPRS